MLDSTPDPGHTPDGDQPRPDFARQPAANEDPSNESNPPQLTTNEGRPVCDNQHSITAGYYGPVAMSDYELLEKSAQFNRERIPERVVHAKGSGAFGTFTCTNAEIAAKYSCAAPFAEAGKQTPVAARFSTVGGEQGSSDTARDPRGFAVKFYTEEGNWDLVGNNTPVFFIRDPLKFSDFIHTQKRHPTTGRKDPSMMWDFWSLMPEALHQVTILFSDRGIPASYRNMNGYGSHTYSCYPASGRVGTNGEQAAEPERFWIKIHMTTDQGIKNLTADEAQKMDGKNPDSARQDLYESIERGEFPSWTMSWQIMPEADARSYAIHPFDLTKVWPHDDYPLVEVGRFELNRNPENFFAEIEQLAVSPVNIIPGLGYSPDKMLQGRLISYPDAHRYRLGTNYQQIPVNAARCPVATYNKDGAMRVDGNNGGCPVYHPNSFGGPVEKPSYKEHPTDLDARRSGRFADWHLGPDHQHTVDDFQQPGDLFRLMDEGERDRLASNIADSMAEIPERLKRANIELFSRCDAEYGRRVAKKLGLEAAIAGA